MKSLITIIGGLSKMNDNTKIYNRLIVLPVTSLILISSHSFAQKLDKCPSGEQRIEVGISLNTPEPFYTLGSMKTDDQFLDGGEYKNKTIALGVFGKYFLNKDNNEALRLRFVCTNKNINDHRELSNGAGVYSIWNVHYTQRYYKISPGFQWTIMKNRISLFGGIEVPVTIIGKNKQDFYAKDEYDDQTFFSESTSQMTVDGGFSAGLGLFFGSNYFFTKNLGIGFDLSAAYLYTAVGGKIITKEKINSTTENSERELEWDESNKEYKFSPIQGAINLTFKF
jgi:hypothetical protein